MLERIPELVIMGGAHDHGNSTASAEFNIWLDPEAARIVVNCGRPIRMMPLDATHRALVSLEDARRLRALGTPAGEAAATLHREADRRLRRDPADAPPGRRAGPRRAGGLRDHRPDDHHDPLHPRGRGDRRGAVQGRTVCDFRFRSKQAPNVQFAMDADEPKFVAMLTEILGRTA